MKVVNETTRMGIVICLFVGILPLTARAHTEVETNALIKILANSIQGEWGDDVIEDTSSDAEEVFEPVFRTYDDLFADCTETNEFVDIDPDWLGWTPAERKRAMEDFLLRIPVLSTTKNRDKSVNEVSSHYGIIEDRFINKECIMSLNIVTEIDNRVTVKNVLMSVSDKTGLETFVPALVKACPGVKIYSTGGTYTKVKEILGDKAEGTLVAVSDYTGQPEMQGGLVKTLDFKIYLGLLSETYNDAHQADIKRLDAQAIDMVVVNLYPFRETVAKAGVTPEMARTNIDIGGPCMVRASAKNYLRVASVTDPLDYPNLVQELESHAGTIGLDTRFKLMKKAFTHTAEYDTAIANFFTTRTWEEVDSTYTQH